MMIANQGHDLQVNFKSGQKIEQELDIMCGAIAEICQQQDCSLPPGTSQGIPYGVPAWQVFARDDAIMPSPESYVGYR